jgi:hypothetical protein
MRLELQTRLQRFIAGILPATLPELVDIFGKRLKLRFNLLSERQAHGIERDHGVVYGCERGLVFSSVFEDFHDLLEVILRALSSSRFLLVIRGQEGIVFCGHVILATRAFFDSLGKAYVSGRLVKY